MKLLSVFLFLLPLCIANVYLHFPRGSNNRLNGKWADREANDRLFDSQNLDEGGYNVGEDTNLKFGSHHIPEFYGGSKISETLMPIVLTMQHGCGKNNDNVRCNVVLEYACDTDYNDFSDQDGNDDWNGLDVNLQDGTRNRRSTFSQTFPFNTKNRDSKSGHHESDSYYAINSWRENNGGLFTADQKLDKKKATHTRQNPRGARHGYESPEERDYFPYWHPSIWKTIAVFTDDLSMCKFYRKESPNDKKKHMCTTTVKSVKDASSTSAKNAIKKIYSSNNQADCEINGGNWDAYMGTVNQKDLDYEKGSFQKPHCQETPWSKSNHLGIVNGLQSEEDDADYFTYMWSLPIPSEIGKAGCKYDGEGVNIVVRARYNITSTDYDGWNTDADSNNNKKIIETDPFIHIEKITLKKKLKLSLNTAQVGRVFQDRSHVLRIIKRPKSKFASKKVHVVSVMGKRGHLVEAFPALQYEFVPNKLTVTKDNWISFSWTGSNSHNGCDRADRACEVDNRKTSGIDRNNIISVPKIGDVFPLIETDSRHFAKNFHCLCGENVWCSEADTAIILMSSGYYKSVADMKTKQLLQPRLNNATPTMEQLLCQANKVGTFILACSRNNEPGFLSQYLQIIVSST